ncbi:MAG TPA: insulinase family protein [Thermoanaerobaculia bacterium]|nr:insulinase family protein [Thermoanaerobaculia bacterium]
MTIDRRFTSSCFLATLALALAALASASASASGSGAPAAAAPAPALPAVTADPAPALPAVTTDPASPLPLDPAIATGRYANGLTWYIRDNARPEKRAQLWLAVNAGSVLEGEDQRGLAHFVEHMCFDGTRKFPKFEITRYLEAIGMRLGPDFNAFTDFDETVYMIKVPTDKPEFVDKGIEILSEWAHAVSFDPAEFERERRVVIEEWRLGRGAEARMRDRQLPIVLAGSRYADRLPIGTLASLEQAKREALMRFYHDWYRPDLMAVVAVGDFSAYGRERLERQLRQSFAGLANPVPERPRTAFPVPEHADTRYAIATDSEATGSRAAIEVMQPKRPERGVGDYRRELVEGLYHGMLNARLSELTRRPDPPFRFAVSTSGSFIRPIEVERQIAAVANGGLLPGLQALLAEVERVHRHGFSAAELERQKAVYLRQLESAFAERDKVESERRAGEIQGLFLDAQAVPGEAFELALSRKLLPGIELDEVNRLAASWTSEANRVIEINAPAKPDVPVPAEAQLREVFAAVQRSDVAAWVDRTREGPLVPEPPKPGTVVAESRIAELGVTEWRLSNGARVVLKPTDFKNDEVLLSGFSPGGLSLVPEASFTSGQLAPALVREGGLGTFDAVTLRKALTGKAAEAGAALGEFEEDVRGGASPRDVETMFQLAYLSLTAPRRDQDAYRSAVARLRAAIENRSSQPQVVFADKMQKALHPGDPRERPLTVERLAELDYDTAFRLYQERFADASQFTFFLVGNFTVDAIRPLVLTYLGGLPSLGRKESWRPVGGKPPDGVVHVPVVKGKEPKSMVRIVFSGDGQYTRQNVHDLTTLLRLVDLRLHEVLRDEMGGVYGVGVGGALDSRPYERFTVTISFSCAPEKVEELTHAVFQELEALQRRGTDQEHLDKIKASQRRERETSLKENGFWLGVLTNYYRSAWDPRDILRFDELVERMSTARLQAAAREYLPLGRYVIGVLSPESAGAAGGAPAAAPAQPAAPPPQPRPAQPPA